MIKIGMHNKDLYFFTYVENQNVLLEIQMNMHFNWVFNLKQN